MNINKKIKKMKVGIPKVEEAHEFLEITRDFTDPKEAIREAISNSIDWGATKIEITVKEDKTVPEEELILEIHDNGIGLNDKRLAAFFDLGRTTSPEPGNLEKLKMKKIGYKGHGTKTYFNSRQIEVYSDSSDCTVYAIMELPLQKLMNKEIPKYEYDIENKVNKTTFTKVAIRGYNQNKIKEDFAHNVLKDYILCFTRIGSIEREFNMSDNENAVILLQGLGKKEPEEIKFGHIFPEEDFNIYKLNKERPADWTKIFVKRWLFPNRQIEKYPGKTIDMIFYIEGDEAKRSYDANVANSFYLIIKELRHL